MDDNIGEIFYLDWHRDKLIGYERKKHRLDILAMELGIKSGVKIPAVCVVKKKSHIYEIQYGADPDRNLLDSWSGGHHRSRARFNLDSPLKCIAVGGHWENPRGNINVPIEDIMIVEGFYSSECMRHSLSCLPTEVAEKFCREHGLNTDTYLSQ